MVKYLCEICNTKYTTLEDAEKCEKIGLIGPELKKGLLLSHNSVTKGFMVIYGEVAPKGHERTYFVEEIRNASEDFTYPLATHVLLGGNLKDHLKPWRVSTDEEVDKLNRIIQSKTKGTRSIQAYLDNFNVEELHNKCNLDDIV